MFGVKGHPCDNTLLKNYTLCNIFQSVLILRLNQCTLKIIFKVCLLGTKLTHFEKNFQSGLWRYINIFLLVSRYLTHVEKKYIYMTQVLEWNFKFDDTCCIMIC